MGMILTGIHCIWKTQYTIRKLSLSNTEVRMLVYFVNFSFILYKWKNHLFKMKGDIGMVQSMKKEETRSHYTAKTCKATWHHPYIFVLLIHPHTSVLLIHRQKVSVKGIGKVSCSFACLSCVYNDPLFLPFFHFEPSLYPPSFWRNVFALVKLKMTMRLRVAS